MADLHYCSVANYECVNPAGYGTSNGHATNPDGPRVSVACSICGDPVCSGCRTKIDGEWVCDLCVVDDEAGDADRLRDFGPAMEGPNPTIA